MISFEPGDVIDQRFRIDGALGRGGFGVVYRATDLGGGTPVAIKFATPDEGERYSPSMRRRFEREVAALTQLRSDHTVQLLAHGITGFGQLYMVFELLAGEDLADVLAREGSLDASVVMHILRQLLDSLGEAHRAGLLHRDIKPENIRVVGGSDPWRVKLLDFGIARQAGSERPQITKTGELMGTPRYMSPEQLMDGEVTAASDIYALGVVVFEMLAGPGALAGHGLAAQLDRLRSGYLFAVPDQDSSILHRVVQRMTARKLDRRYRTVEQVRRALDDEVAPALAQGGRASIGPRHALVAGAVVAVVAGVLFAAVHEPATDSQPAPVPQSRIPHALVKADEPSLSVEAPSPPPVDMNGASPDAGLDTGPLGDCSASPFVGYGKLRFRDTMRAESWETYIPQSASRGAPMPLVILLHGKFETPEEWLSRSGFPELADRHGFAVIAPFDRPELIVDNPWGEEELVGWVRAIFEETAGQLCIDRSRVFAAGHFAGAWFVAKYLVCEPWLTAVAGNVTHTIPTACSPQVPMLWTWPTQSDYIPIAGGRNCMGSTRPPRDRQLRRWRRKMNCTDEFTVTYDAGGDECRRWACEIPLETCVFEGAHGWPGMATSVLDLCPGPVPQAPAAEIIWTFFDSQAPTE